MTKGNKRVFCPICSKMKSAGHSHAKKKSSAGNQMKEPEKK